MSTNVVVETSAKSKIYMLLQEWFERTCLWNRSNVYLITRVRARANKLESKWIGKISHTHTDLGIVRFKIRIQTSETPRRTTARTNFTTLNQFFHHVTQNISRFGGTIMYVYEFLIRWDCEQRIWTERRRRRRGRLKKEEDARAIEMPSDRLPYIRNYSIFPQDVINLIFQRMFQLFNISTVIRVLKYHRYRATFEIE